MKKLLLYFCIFSCLFAIEKYRETDILSVWKTDHTSLELVEYKTKESLGILNSQKRQKELWNVLVAFYPPEIIEKIDTFIIFSDNRADNEGGMFGLIETINPNNKSFIFSLDIEEAYYRNLLNLEILLPLLTHEFFHMLSLNETQLSHLNTGGLKIFEGYVKQDSYLNKFYEQFWTNSFTKRLELLEKDPGLSYEKKKEIRNVLYENNKDKFVNSYAMTNVVEDIAVSFEEFVKIDKNHLKDELKDKKLLFFYSYPELIRYKDNFTKKRKELLKK